MSLSFISFGQSFGSHTDALYPLYSISGILVCAIPVPPPGLKLDSSAIGKDCIFNIRTSCGLPAPAAAPAQLAARNIPIIGDLLGGLPIIGPLLASLPIVGGLLGNSPVNGGTGLLG